MVYIFPVVKIMRIKICEVISGKEVRPFDISITKTVVVLFINSILLLICILIPARWCKKHRPEDPAPKGFTGLMTMFIMYIYDDIIKATLGKIQIDLHHIY